MSLPKYPASLKVVKFGIINSREEAVINKKNSEILVKNNNLDEADKVKLGYKWMSKKENNKLVRIFVSPEKQEEKMKLGFK